MRQTLFMMLGHPGSGKSYFAKQLAPKIDAVRFNADHLRTTIASTYHKIPHPDAESIVFGSLNYATYETLKAGHSVLYDIQHNKQAHREKLTKMAANLGVWSVIVWIKTPYDVALLRGQTRDETPDQRKKSEAHMRALLDRCIRDLEPPTANEALIALDGTQDFTLQYADFIKQLDNIAG